MVLGCARCPAFPDRRRRTAFAESCTLNEWTEAAETWLTAGVWEAVQASDLDLGENYRGRPAWLAVDLSSKRDLTALMVVVESFDARGDSSLLAFPRFWMPADGVLERSEARRRGLCDMA